MKKNAPTTTFTLTPKLSYKTTMRDFYRELNNFTDEILRSFKWFSMGEYSDAVKLMDASPASQMKFELNDLLKRWNKRAGDVATRLSLAQQRRLLRYSNRKFKASLGVDFKQSSKQLNEVLKARYYENVRLIKTIPQHVFNDYASVFYNGIVQGDRASIEKQLLTIAGVSQRRVKTIARDQTAKMLEAIATTRAQQLGLEYYVWDTSDDERVSTGYGGHKKLEGLIFRYDTPEAVIDSYGHKGHPKQRVLCRCSARGVFLLPGQTVKKTTLGYKIMGLAE